MRLNLDLIGKINDRSWHLFSNFSLLSHICLPPSHSLLGVNKMNASLLKIHLDGNIITKILLTLLLVSIHFTWILEVKSQQKNFMGSPNVVHRTVPTSQIPFVCWDFPRHC